MAGGAAVSSWGAVEDRRTHLPEDMWAHVGGDPLVAGKHPIAVIAVVEVATYDAAMHLHGGVAARALGV